MGTQSVRVLVFSEQGELIDFSRVVYESAYSSPKTGWAEQEPEFYWQSLLEAFSQLWKKKKVKPKLFDP